MKNFQQFLEDLNTIKNNTNLDNKTTPNILNVNINPNTQNHTLTFNAQIKGTQTYNTTIQFLNVQFTEIPKQPELGHFILTNPKTKQKFYFQIPNKSQQDIKTNCDCPHFQIRLKKAHIQHNTLAEDTNLPQICKHINTLIEYLENKGILFNQPYNITTPNMGDYNM
jgi:hypothetical protein